MNIRIPLLLLAFLFSAAQAADPASALKLDPEKDYVVRLTLVGQTRLLNIGELQVFSGDTNIALAGKASMSSSAQEYPPANLIDGNTTGKRSEPGGLAHSSWEVAPWAEIALPKTDRIDKIVVWNRFPDGEDATTRLIPFKLTICDAEKNVVWEMLIRHARIQTRTEAKAGDNRFQKIEVSVMLP